MTSAAAYFSLADIAAPLIAILSMVVTGMLCFFVGRIATFLTNGIESTWKERPVQKGFAGLFTFVFVPVVFALSLKLSDAKHPLSPIFGMICLASAICGLVTFAKT